MATSNSTSKRGNYIRKIGFYDVYCKFSWNKETGKNRQATGSSLDLYHAKRLIQAGFKTIEEIKTHVSTLS